jgi:uncharacterized protein YndB with AHSA1/START domain
MEKNHEKGINRYGTITEPGTIRFERLLPGPIERVWSYLTESEKRGKWLAFGTTEPRIGGTVELRFFNTQLSPHKEPIPERYKEDCADGVSFSGKVTAYEPPRLLGYTWGNHGEVTLELIPQEKNVLLVLTHRGLEKKIMNSVASGWHTHLDILVDNLIGEIPRPFWSTHAKLELEYETRLGSE